MKQPSPSTPIVPGTAGLNEAEAAQHDELYVGDELDQLAEDIERDGFMGGPGRLSAKQVRQAYYGNPGWRHVADRLNALLAAKPAEPQSKQSSAVDKVMTPQEWAFISSQSRHKLNVFFLQAEQREARIRKDVLREAFLLRPGLPHEWNSTQFREGYYAGLEAFRQAIEKALAERPAPAGKVKAFGTFTCPICGKDSPHSHPELELAGLSMAQTISAILNHRGLIGLDELAALCGKTLAEEWHKREVKGEK